MAQICKFRELSADPNVDTLEEGDVWLNVTTGLFMGFRDGLIVVLG